MAGALYPKYKQSLLTQSPSIDIGGDVIKAGIGRVADGFTFNTAHQFYGDVESVMVSAYGATVTIPGMFVLFQSLVGTFTPTIQFPITTGAAVDFVIVFCDKGTSATSPLLAYLPLAGPVTPSSGHVVQITWGGGIFSI